MATQLLSAAECKNATSNGARIRKLHDGDGLYLWVYLDGRKYWRLRYWQADKEKSLSLGVYPKISLSDARKQCDELRKQLQANLDPSAERKAILLQQKLAHVNSFEAVALEWYNKQLHTWVPHHASDVKRRLESNIFPTLGKRPIDQISALELLETLRKIESRGAYDLAHRVLQVCGQVFRYGIATGRCSRNLSTDLRGALTPHVKQHQSAVRPEELPELLRAIAKYDETGDRQTRLALQLLAQTFVRTSELIGAEWVEFDLDHALWIIPAERMKMKTEHIVPLARQAITLLTELKQISRGSRFVFPGRNRDKPISNNTMLFALYRMGYKGKMTGHGFRAVASTILNETGFTPDAIERQLAHCERNEVRGAYNRAEYLPERKKMMQFWADHLDKLQAGADIIPLKTTA
ncbi:tyrosine-type recombinase/integrase [Ferrovum sp.]|jgi:Integrase|uniref:tyrosine-type recombinase/integrase n=1 Tax=Ferrovum sp. TaxID=2609467 RepID=UPI0023127CFC|nr:tyrosine-type recombinase/integrase [Ferrovum sp.]MDA8416435.1 tyrosine-type recombinase/integrase [Betaproteobacteria bacterium]